MPSSAIPASALSLHYTGPLLTWLIAERAGRHRAPARARRRATRSRSSAAATTSPSSPRCPSATASASWRAWPTSWSDLFGRRPRGAWLAERVWEPDLPTSLVAAGYEWTILDDAHFRAAAIPEEDLWGPYTTEDQGHLLRVFGTEQGLRYRIPFREVDEVIEYLREHATEAARPGRDDGRRRREVRCLADDLGALLGRGPLGRAVLRGPRGERRLADDDDPVGLAGRPPADRARLRPDRLATRRWANGRCRPTRASSSPRSSHAAQDGAPPGGTLAARRVLAQLPGEVPRDQRPAQADAAGVRRPSRRCRAGAGPRRAIDHLYQGQSNDCYWHGLFGGIYISHMRLATYEHLIAAEDLAEGPRWARSWRPRRATSTWTGSTRSAWPTRARS